MLKTFILPYRPKNSYERIETLANLWKHYQVALPHLVTAQFFEEVEPVFRNVSPNNIVEVYLSFSFYQLMHLFIIEFVINIKFRRDYGTQEQQK